MATEHLPVLHNGNAVWQSMTLAVADGPGGSLNPPHTFKVLHIEGSPFVAIPGARANTWTVVKIDSGQIVRYTRGTKSDARMALINSERNYIDDLEMAQRAAKQAEDERHQRKTLDQARQEVERRQALEIHGPGLYITPFCMISDDEDDEDEEGFSFGPFNDDADLGDAEEAEAVYWQVLPQAPPDTHVALIEAPSRADALLGNGHVWIIDGLEKGPPVDPRQVGFDFDKPRPNRISSTQHQTPVRKPATAKTTVRKAATKTPKRSAALSKVLTKYGF